MIDVDGQSSLIVFAYLKKDGSIADLIEVVIHHDPSMFFIGSWIDSVLFFLSGLAGESLG